VSGWYVIPSLPPDNTWKGFATRGYIRASEAPDDLMLTPEEIQFVPEDVQAAELDWTISTPPLNLWTLEDEDQFSTDWYEIPEAPIFYWDLDLEFAPFYGEQKEPDFYWTLSDQAPAFYPTIVAEPQFYWINETLPTDRFYLVATPVTSFYWILNPEPCA